MGVGFRSLDGTRLDPDTQASARPQQPPIQEELMAFFRALIVALFRPYAHASAVRGGSGHYNEQCHPQTYG